MEVVSSRDGGLREVMMHKKIDVLLGKIFVSLSLYSSQSIETHNRHPKLARCPPADKGRFEDSHLLWYDAEV